jgi:hypothetical protein
MSAEVSIAFDLIAIAGTLVYLHYVVREFFGQRPKGTPAYVRNWINFAEKKSLIGQAVVARNS